MVGRKYPSTVSEDHQALVQRGSDPAYCVRSPERGFDESNYKWRRTSRFGRMNSLADPTTVPAPSLLMRSSWISTLRILALSISNFGPKSVLNASTINLDDGLS